MITIESETWDGDTVTIEFSSDQPPPVTFHIFPGPLKSALGGPSITDFEAAINANPDDS